MNPQSPTALPFPPARQLVAGPALAAKLTRRAALLWLLVIACVASVTAAPLKVCLISGSAEYDSDTSLAALQNYLERGYSAHCTLLKAQGFDSLPGLEALDDCDVALFFTRRLTIDGEQLERVRKYCLSGRPLVAVRTASHGFQKWLEFDRLVLGGNYQNHNSDGPTQKATISAGQENHPVLDGVPSLKSRASLYRNTPLAADVQVLMTATTPVATEPVTWTRQHAGGRVFYTSLGGKQDFENATFLRLLANALYWTAGRPVERLALPPVAVRPRPDGTVKLRLRTRVESAAGSGDWREVAAVRDVPVAETAIILCDMWDKHWCDGATRRCDEIATRMAPVIRAARAKGIQIIHAPSETMSFYADSPQRRRVLGAPVVELPTPRNRAEPALPIDDSDGGCDTAEKPWYEAWSRQSARLDIGEFDAISDDGRAVYNFLRQRGIKYLIVCGVHTNMCVLNRSFAIRQMTRWGLDCFLLRDLTDTMYNPAMPPHVTHDEGTARVIEHIEKYWCPSLTGADLLSGLP